MRRTEVNTHSKKQPIHIIMHTPTSEADRAELVRRAAQLRANALIRRIRDLSCTAAQKSALAAAVATSLRQQSGEQT